MLFSQHTLEHHQCFLWFFMQIMVAVDVGFECRKSQQAAKAGVKRTWTKKLKHVIYYHFGIKVNSEG